MNKILTLIIVAFIFSFTGCNNSADPNSGNDKREYPFGPDFTDTEKTRTQALQDFGVRFMNAVSKSGNYNDRNLIVSPLSASILLSMLANAADEESRQEIIDVLGFPEMTTIGELNETMKKITYDLPHDVKGSSINISNGFWYSTMIGITSNYDFSLKNIFDCHSTQLDFTNEKSFYVPSKWIKEKTNGKITSIPGMSEMCEPFSWLAVNALCFEADWHKPFETSNTYNYEFTNADGSKSVVRMMKGEQYIKFYMKDDTGRFLQVGYDNLNISMNIYFPDTPSDEYLSDVSKTDFDTFFKNASEIAQGYTVLHLPKYEENFDPIDLTLVFPDMGINKIFNKSSLSQIKTGDANSHVSQILQQVLFSMDEKGVKAVAATSATGDISPGPSGMPAEIKIDRPFVFSITAYGLPLIYGRISNLGKE